MERRDFIKVLGITSIISLPSLSLISGKREFRHWAWLQGNNDVTDTQLRDFLKKMKNNNIHGILPGGGNEFYNRIGPIAKSLDMEFHAWRWTINRGGHMTEHPEWYAVSRNGDSVIDKPPYVNYYRWLCPSRPEVEELLINDYTELCDIEGMTGVHLDYVRYCDVILPIALQPKYNLVQDHEMPEYDFCYCDLCRSNFKKEYGTDPLNMAEPDKSKEWHQWRLDQLVRLVNIIASEVHNKGKQISAAVFPTPSIARKIVRQDWERFELDAFMPMIYFNDYNGDLEWVAKIVKEDVKILKGKAKLYAGLNMGHVRDFGIKDVVETCISNGAQGVSFFTGNSMSDEEWSQFSKTMAGLEQAF